MLISLDTETTGIDLQHGAKPFFVTITKEDESQLFWEWDVDPLTRQPIIPFETDLDEIQAEIDNASGIVLQNGKFDARALATIFKGTLRWPWDKMEDTLQADHVLASNKPHRLDAQAIRYLGVDITKYEDKLKVACNDARRYARTHQPSWRIAKEGLPEMPSAKSSSNKDKKGVESESPWKFDCWLPRALAMKYNLRKTHPWWTVTAEYANMDSNVTLPLFIEQKRHLQKRGLWRIYREKMKVLPIISSMEDKGVTYSRSSLAQLRKEYEGEVNRCKCVLTNIAAEHNYTLELPKGAVNNSLRNFCFDVLKLEPIRNPKAKTDAPCLDSKNAIPYYLATLPKASMARMFIKTLTEKSARATALTAMASYEKFSRPHTGGVDWRVIHPSLNPTGTATLRFSSSNPNEQNISKRGIDNPCGGCAGAGDGPDGKQCPICKGEGTVAMNLRYCFGPAPGREWWSCDAKNIELRIPAYESGEEAFIALFERPDDPPYYGSNHLLISHLLHKQAFENCLSCVKCMKEVRVPESIPQGKFCQCQAPSPIVDGRVFKKRYASSKYQRIKNGNFAVQYGAIDREDGLGTADRTYGIPGAQAQIKARFTKQEALNQHWIRYADKHGYVETMVDHSVDPTKGYPLLCTRTDYGRILPTVPLNYHVQGTAMWWMIKAMIRVEAQLKLWRDMGFDGWMVMQVHDELVFDFPKHGNPVEESKGKGLFRRSNLWRMQKIVQLMQEGGNDIRVPTPVSCEYHPENWSEGISIAI